MSNPYKPILDEFDSGYKASPNRFHELIEIAFDKAKNINDDDAVNKMFCLILYRQWTVDQIKYMVELGANPRCNNDSPLRILANYSNTDAVLYLINDCGANVRMDYILRDGCWEMSIDMIKTLLDNGGQVDDIHPNIIKGYEYIDLLVERGYDVRIILRHISINAMYSNKYYQLILDQIKNGQLELDNSILHQMFLYCIRSGKITIDDINAFIVAGVNVNDCSEAPYDNVSFFAELCRYDATIPRYLIKEYPVDVNACDGQALVNALSAGKMETVKLLLESGANVLSKHIERALEIGIESMVLLLDYGGINEEQLANVIAKDVFHNVRYTKSSYGCDSIGIFNNNACVAKALIKRGIDFNQIILNLPD